MIESKFHHCVASTHHLTTFSAENPIREFHFSQRPGYQLYSRSRNHHHSFFIYPGPTLSDSIKHSSRNQYSHLEQSEYDAPELLKLVHEGSAIGKWSLGAGPRPKQT